MGYSHLLLLFHISVSFIFHSTNILKMARRFSANSNLGIAKKEEKNVENFNQDDFNVSMGDDNLGSVGHLAPDGISVVSGKYSGCMFFALQILFKRGLQDELLGK